LGRRDSCFSDAASTSAEDVVDEGAITRTIAATSITRAVVADARKLPKAAIEAAI